MVTTLVKSLPPASEGKDSITTIAPSGCQRRLSQRGVHPRDSQTQLCRNCAKTLSVLNIGDSFERKADSPSCYKHWKVKKGRESLTGRNACKADALPAELHAHRAYGVYFRAIGAVGKTAHLSDSPSPAPAPAVQAEEQSLPRIRRRVRRPAKRSS